MNPLFVGIDVSSRSNVAYLMKPDGSKHSSFSVQNNLGGAKLLSERIVSALHSMQLERVVIGLLLLLRQVMADLQTRQPPPRRYKLRPEVPTGCPKLYHR